MLNPDAKEYNLISREILVLPDKQLFLPDVSVFYDKKNLLIPFRFNFKKNLRVPKTGLKNNVLNTKN